MQRNYIRLVAVAIAYSTLVEDGSADRAPTRVPSSRCLHQDIVRVLNRLLDKQNLLSVGTQRPFAAKFQCRRHTSPVNL